MGRGAEQASHIVSDDLFKRVHLSQAHSSFLPDSDAVAEEKTCAKDSMTSFNNSNK